MRLCDLLHCLVATWLLQCAQSATIPSSSIHVVETFPSSRQTPRSSDLHRRQRNSPFTLDVVQPSLSESFPSTVDVFQPEVTDDFTTLTDDFSSDLSVTSTTTDDELSSTRDLVSTTVDTKTTSMTSSQNPTVISTTASGSVRSTATTTPSATASKTPDPKRKPFRMDAASIAATVVLCCFVCGGAAIMLFYRMRRHTAWRRHHQPSSPDSDVSHGARHKSTRDSLASSTIAARESLMYHPEHRDSRSTVNLVKYEWNEGVREREPPYDYRIEHTDIPMSDIEVTHDADHSPVSPLLPPTLPKPISNIGRKGDRPGLRREFSFEEKEQRPSVVLKDPRLNRSSALTSNPSSEWPLGMPTYYGRISPSCRTPDPATAENKRNIGGWRSVTQRPSFEEVRIRGD